MSNYSAAQGGDNATTYEYPFEEGYGTGVNDDATAGQNGFVVVQTLEPVPKIVQDVGIFARG